MVKSQNFEKKCFQNLKLHLFYFFSVDGRLQVALFIMPHTLAKKFILTVGIQYLDISGIQASGFHIPNVLY